MLDDLATYADAYLKIVTKDSKVASLSFNPYQKQISEKIKELRKDGKPVRIIVLKCRQIGVSTFGTAFTFHTCATGFYQKGLIIANDNDSSTNLFTMSKRYYDFLPDKLKPMIRYSNAKQLVFENPDVATRSKRPGLMSSITVESAQDNEAGRSGTYQHAHCSEIAFWPNPGTVISSLFQSIPLRAGTSILIESTANGISGRGQEFYDRWKAAESGESDFVPMFFDWADNPDYELTPPDGFTLSKEEIDLKQRFPKLTERKLAYRRYKINNEMGSAILNPVDQWNQEYPSHPEMAFISSGRPVLSMAQITSDIERVKAQKSLESKIDGLEVYSETTCRVAIGADVAEGIESGDYSAATVLDKDYNQIASYHKHIAPDLFGRDLCKIGAHYGNAILAVEVNNHGHSTLSKIKDLGYPNIFHRTVKEEISNQPTKKIGWQTNAKTKMEMLDEMVALYRDGILKLNDVNLLREMATLRVEPDGDVKLSGKDRVVSVCIAIQALKQVSGERLGAIIPREQKDAFAQLTRAQKHNDYSFK